MLAFGREDEHAARAGGPDVALGVQLEAVAGTAASLALQRGREEDVPQAGTIEVADGDSRILAVRYGEVQGLLVEAQGDAVRPLHFLRHEGDLAVGRQLIDAMVGGLGLFSLGDAVGRVGEEDRAVLGHAQIVRAVEAGAVLVLRREHLELAVTAEAGDAAGAVLAKQHVALRVDGETVGTLVGGGSIGTAGLQEDGGYRVTLDPLVGDVVRDIGEDDASLVPGRSFRPGIIARRDRLDLGVARDQGFERRIQLLDGLLGAFGGEGGDDGEEEGGEELHG